jgi:lysozyme family protein
MSSPAFDAAVTFVLRWEGGFVDHPDDPGGRTNKGVTQKVYDGWRTRQGQPPRDVKLIDAAEVEAIYASDYWVPPRCDLLESPLDVVQFGTQRAVAQCDAGTVLGAYCDRRETFYRNLAQNNPKLEVFLKGWLNRLNALRREVGLPGFEGVAPIDFGDAGYIARVPDIGEDPDIKE